MQNYTLHTSCCSCFDVSDIDILCIQHPHTASLIYLSEQDVSPITGHVPDPAAAVDPSRTSSMQRSLDYMGLRPGTPLEGLKVDKVFIGSCTNAR
jgi:homoaconitase/3-isopropylmalate dehydratase large subunit